MRLYEIKFLNDAKLDLRRVYSRVCTTSGSSARASKVVGMTMAISNGLMP